MKVPEVLPPIERRFEDNPKISEHKIVISHPPLRRPDSSHLRDAFSMEKYNTSRSGYLPKCHEVLRLPRKVTLHLHQILRLPHKMNRISAPHHIWNVISNARSKQSHPPTWPNTAPATKFWVKDCSAKSLNCFRQYKDDSRIIRRYPRISEDKIVISHPPLQRPSPCDLGDNFCIWKIQHFALRLSPKMSRSAAPATESHTPPSPNTAPVTKSLLELWLYWTVTLLNCDSTELLLYWTVTLLNCYSTELRLYWTVTLLNCDSTELWLYWTVTRTVLNCDSTELWLYWTVTLLNCYSTELLNCYSTEQLWLYWTVTLLKFKAF